MAVFHGRKPILSLPLKKPSVFRPQQREVFYGRIKGRPLRAAARQALEKSDFIFENKEEARNFLEKFPETHFEIGFGAGEHLIARAKENPGIGFIGAEAYQNGIAKCALHTQEAGLKNLAIWPQDARPLLDTLPEKSLGAIYLLYPDPWPKRRHWKRRLVSDQNLARFARLIKPGARLYFATDWENYAAWALSHLLRSPDFSWDAGSARDWKEPFYPWTSTRYEQKALREGRMPSYLCFTRKA
jgi:tRNA (guanine-N7-)-methyltransferase